MKKYLADGSISLIADATCSDNSMQFVDASTTPDAIVQCPAGCADDSYAIWGSDIYTNDSNICAAAIHAGVISNDEGGLIVVTYVEGQETYTASESNGITTSEYGSWGDSFSVSPISDE